MFSAVYNVYVSHTGVYWAVCFPCLFSWFLTLFLVSVPVWVYTVCRSPDLCFLTTSLPAVLDLFARLFNKLVQLHLHLSLQFITVYFAVSNGCSRKDGTALQQSTMLTYCFPHWQIKILTLYDGVKYPLKGFLHQCHFFLQEPGGAQTSRDGVSEVYDTPA